MKCNNTLYVIASFNCNLECPHCSIRFQKCETNLEKINETLYQSHFENCIFFGGEPLFDLNLFNQIISTKKITSISSNLLLLTENIASIIKENNIGVATSWNLKRFTESQYSLWHNKLNILDNKNINCTVLITLTNDLINVNPKTIYDNVILKIAQHRSVDEIKFEYLVADNSLEYYSKCDDWLIGMHKVWAIDKSNCLFDQLKNGNIRNCHNVFTITPDGCLYKGCPNSLCYKKHYFLDDCSNCEHNKICQPCILQKYCSFPKKLFAYLKQK